MSNTVSTRSIAALRGLITTDRSIEDMKLSEVTVSEASASALKPVIADLSGLRGLKAKLAGVTSSELKVDTESEPFVDVPLVKPEEQPEHSQPESVAQVEAKQPRRRLSRRSDESAVVDMPDTTGQGPDPRLETKECLTSEDPQVPTRPVPEVVRHALAKPEAGPSAVRVITQETREGPISIIDFEYTDIDMSDFIELSMQSKSKLSVADVKRLSQYERQQYKERVEVWQSIARNLLDEVNSMPVPEFVAIYNEIAEANITLKPEPDFQSCWEQLGMAYNLLQRMSTLKTRIMPHVAVLNSAYDTLVDTWKTISLESSDDTRTGEAKLLLEPLVHRRAQLKALLDVITERMTVLKVGWDTVSRQQTALEQALNAGPRRPVDPDLPEFNEHAFGGG